MKDQPSQSLTSFKSRGAPGAEVRSKGLSQALYPFIGLVFVSGWAFAAVIPASSLTLSHAAILLMILAVAMLITWKRALNLVSRHEEGARGEEQVARLLESLPEGWRIYHGVPFTDKKMDHVVVSPDHVFAIETVHWLGQVRLTDQKLLHQEKAYPGYDLPTLQHRGEQVATELGIPSQVLTPLVCIVGGRLNQPAGEHDGVWIGELEELGMYLLQVKGNGLDNSERISVLEKLDVLLDQEDSL